MATTDIPVVLSGILGYGTITTLFQYWIVTLVENRVRRRDRLGVAFVNLILMPAGQALVVAIFFGAVGTYVTTPHPSPSSPTGLSRIFPLWVNALEGFYFGGLLLSVLPRVGRYFRDPEISIFSGGLFAAIAYKHPGLTSGLAQVWAFARGYWFLVIGLLVLAKAISLGSRYGIGLVMRTGRAAQGPRAATPRLPLAFVLGTSSTIMLIPLLVLLRLVIVPPQ